MPRSEMRKSAPTSYRVVPTLIVEHRTEQHIDFRRGQITSIVPYPSSRTHPAFFIPLQGVVTLSDFGLTQVLTDIVGEPVIIALTNASAVRWHAPELNQGDDTTPTMASDVFAFGMSVLELLTMKAPYSHLTRDVSVILDLSKGILPRRPQEPEAVPWMSDELWEMLNKCWKWNHEERLPAKELSPCLEQASETSTQ